MIEFLKDPFGRKAMRKRNKAALVAAKRLRKRKNIERMIRKLRESLDDGSCTEKRERVRTLNIIWRAETMLVFF